jgi:hypothetical protein
MAAFVGRCLVVVASRGVHAAGDFVLLADAVAVRIHQAAACAIVSSRGVGTRAVVVCGRGREVARRRVGASVDFERVAYAVPVCIGQAIPIAIVISRRIIAVSRVCCRRVVIARSAVLATCDLVLFAHAVAIGVDEA